MALMDADFGDYSTGAIVSLVVDLVDRMLTDPGFPYFLKIDMDRADDLRTARLDLGLGLLGVGKTFATVESETDDQTDDVLAYVDANASGGFDAGEPYVIPGTGVLSEETMDILFAVSLMTADLGAAVLDDTDLDVHPGQEDLFHLATLNPVFEDVRYTALDSQRPDHRRGRRF